MGWIVREQIAQGRLKKIGQADILQVKKNKEKIDFYHRVVDVYNKVNNPYSDNKYYWLDSKDDTHGHINKDDEGKFISGRVWFWSHNYDECKAYKVIADYYEDKLHKLDEERERYEDLEAMFRGHTIEIQDK